MKDKIRLLLLIVVLVVISIILKVSYPYAEAVLRGRTAYYHYKIDPKLSASAKKNQDSPAIAVPIIMFHGITKNVDEENTTINNFVADMEMLKREGYTTIDFYDLEGFYRGLYTLPAKPIIITFDDGRKDSYYPTDQVFKALGFKATIFVATNKALENDRFYLTWEELKKMKKSGRWDIQAHGRYSHEKVLNNSDGTIGRYLSSRIFDPQKGLETIREYEQRVTKDYVDGAKDIEKNVGVYPTYFAIPLNDYGNHPNSNFFNYAAFNDALIRRYFRIALVESYVYDPNKERIPSAIIYDSYNYADTDPYRTRRIEVKNMSAQALKSFLDRGFPGHINLNIKAGDSGSFRDNLELLWGKFSVRDAGGSLETEPGEETAKVMLGDKVRWQDYAVSFQTKLEAGRSVEVLAYAPDRKNGVEFGFTDKSLFLRETVNGAQNDLAEPKQWEIEKDTYYTLKLVFTKDGVSAYIDDQLVYNNIKVVSQKGSVGVKIWGDNGAKAVIKSLSVKSNS